MTISARHPIPSSASPCNSHFATTPRRTAGSCSPPCPGLWAGLSKPGIFLAVPSCSCFTAVPFPTGTLRGAALGPRRDLSHFGKPCTAKQQASCCLPRDHRQGRSRTSGHQSVPAKPGAKQVSVPLRAVNISEVHEQSLLGSGTSDPSTLCQLTVVSQCTPRVYTGISLCLVA